MNKKIENLAKESGMALVPIGDDLSDKAIISAKNIEHFAELIIRECANQVNHVYKQGGGTYGETILKHFDLKVNKK